MQRMKRIRRWRDSRRKVVWSEPKLPPYVKINPDAAEPDPGGGLEPGELSMGLVAQEFLATAEEPVDEELPREDLL